MRQDGPGPYTTPRDRCDQQGQRVSAAGGKRFCGGSDADHGLDRGSCGSFCSLFVKPTLLCTLGAMKDRLARELGAEEQSLVFVGVER